MNNFVEALQAKIEELEEERDSLDEKIELLRDILESEDGKAINSGATKKRRGRPKGSKNKKKSVRTVKVSDPKVVEMNQELYQEAMGQLGEEGTTPEMQAKLTGRFSPQPRPVRELGKGVRAGTKGQVVDEHEADADARVGGEEEDEE